MNAKHFRSIEDENWFRSNFIQSSVLHRQTRALETVRSVYFGQKSFVTTLGDDKPTTVQEL